MEPRKPYVEGVRASSQATLQSSCVRAKRVALICVAMIAATSAPASAEQRVFRNPTFEELADITVVSVTRKEQTYFSVPAAVYVISGDDIRRSGARNLPEALRLAPGVEVARISPHRYAVGIRGFNREFTNKLLVLQDGRYLYTPLFAGTFWDMQDTLLDDVERIEVVRGPGGTAWGVNAMNGVINIVTKRATQTTGLAVTAGSGTEDRLFGAVRYGGELGDRTAFRVFLQSAVRDAAVFEDGSSAENGWRQTRGGWRVDSALNDRDSLALHGEVYDGSADEIAFGVPSAVDVRGVYALGRWLRRLAVDRELSLQAYYDMSERDTFQGESQRDEWAIELVNRTQWFGRHDITYGANYRSSRNEASTVAGLSFSTPVRTLSYSSAFVDDAIRFFDNKLTFSAGLKAENNSFTNTEWLPNARVSWQPHEHQLWWAFISRGARLPSISDNDATIALPGFLSLPNTDLPAERLHAFEAGWRMRDEERWSADVAAFYNDYDRLRTRETTVTGPPTTVVRSRDYKLQADSYGLEAVLTLQVTGWWRMQSNVSYFDADLLLARDSTDIMVPEDVGLSPHWQASLRHMVRLGASWELHAFYRYVDKLMRVSVPSYHELDVRLAWQPTKDWQIILAGQNLLHAQHLEIPGQSGQPAGSEVQRGVYLQVRWEL